MIHSTKATDAVYAAARISAAPISIRPRRDSGSRLTSSATPQPASSNAAHAPVRGWMRNSNTGTAHTTRFWAL